MSSAPSNLTLNNFGKKHDEESLWDRSKRENSRRRDYAFKPFRWTEEIPETPVRGKMMPKPRSGHRLVFHEGSVYCFGGYNPDIPVNDLDLAGDPNWSECRPLFKELWRYNTASKRWKKLEMHRGGPNQLASHTAVVSADGRLVVYGGTGEPFGITTSSQVFTLDLQNRNWEVLSASPQDSRIDDSPPSLYGQAVVVAPTPDPSLITIGGTSGLTYFMDVHRLNLTTKKWKRLYAYGNDNADPEPRYRHEMCYYRNRVLVLGGGTSFQSFGFQELPAFNLETNEWDWIKTQPDTTVPVDESLDEQWPEPRRCHSVVQKDQYIFVVGGFDGDNLFSGTWRLDLEDMSWKKLPFDFPKPVYFHSATASPEGKAFVFGGVADIEVNQRSNSLHSCWLDIPSLRSICWEAVNHYAPELCNKSGEDLRREGIPADLVSNLVRGETDRAA